MSLKYAFMTFSTPDLTLDEVLAAARRFGYDGVELRISSNHRHGIELDSDRATRQAARDGGGAQVIWETPVHAR